MSDTGIWQPTRVVVVGGGVVGSEVARRLGRLDPPMAVTLVDPDGVHVHHPLLAEVVSGVVEPRHAAVPLRAMLPRARVLDGEVLGRDAAARTVTVRRRDEEVMELPYHHLVVAPGSVTGVAPVPGLVERALGFRTVADAFHLRDRVLDRMQLAEGSLDPVRRARALTFVVVGAGYSGVGVIGAMRDVAVDACAQLRGVEPDELRFVLVEATDQILPAVGPSVGRAALAELAFRGVEVRLETLVSSVDGDAVRLSDGTDVHADTLVWCAGSRPSPAVEALGLPIADDGAVEVDATLAVPGHPRVWSAGDGAAVPDLVDDRRAPGSAQYARREARTIASNIERAVSGGSAEEFRYHRRCELVLVGRCSAVGEVLGVPVRGFAAWSLLAASHLARVPTWSRKARIVVDRLVDLALPREIGSFGTAHHPHRGFDDVARGLGTERAGSHRPTQRATTTGGRG